MAEFKQGDRVVKMSGVCAGKYGTVNSVREDGTLNVTFDGERLPRYCDPERCGQVAANAGFKIGDRVIIKEWAKQKTAGYGRGTIIKKVGAQFLVRPDEQSHEKYYVPTYAWDEDEIVLAR